MVLTDRYESSADTSVSFTTRWWVKNDAKWVYLLARVPASEFAPGGGAWLSQYWGEYVPPWDYSDGILIRPDGTTTDNYGWDDSKWLVDTEASPPGESNVRGAVSHDSSYYWFEFRKELDSGDGYDWSWTPGEPTDQGNLMVGLWAEEVGAAWHNVRLHLSAP